MTRLAEETVLITGGARGLGRAYALHLGDLGAKVAIIDRDLRSYRQFPDEHPPLAAETIVEELEARGVKASGVELDATDERAMKDAVAELAARLGAISVLVANAGAWVGQSSDPGGRASEISLERYAQVMNGNLGATIAAVNAVVPSMKERRYGRIITIASEAGLQASRQGAFADYGTAKAAIVMYTKYLAQDLGQYGITANCVSPGYVETPQMRSAIGESFRAANALERCGKPDECAAVIEFLAGTAASYVTGAVIDVSGGWVRGHNW